MSVGFQVRRGRRVLIRGPAEPLLGRDSSQVDRRIGVDQDMRVGGAIRDQVSIHCQRLGEPSLLERQVAQQLEGVIPPGATERLFDNPAQATQVPVGRALTIPTFRQTIDAVAVDLSRFDRQLGQTAVAEFPVVNKQNEFARSIETGFVFRELRDLVAIFLDHPLVDVDRLGPLAFPHMGGGISQRPFRVIA